MISEYLILAAGVDDPGGPWGTVAPTEVVEAATGEVLASFETDVAPLGQQSMPIRPNSTEFAIQRNPGRIIVRDWTSVGVEPYATVTPEQRFGAQVAVQLDGTVIDLTEPMSRLGFETGSTRASAVGESERSGRHHHRFDHRDLGPEHRAVRPECRQADGLQAVVRTEEHCVHRHRR